MEQPELNGQNNQAPQPRRRRQRALGTAIVLLVLANVFATPLRRLVIRHRAKQSAIAVAILAHAVESKSRDFGPTPLFPDEAYASVESRKHYGIPTHVPQDLVDQLGQFGPGDPPIYRFLRNTPWEHSAVFFQLRLRQWNCLLWPVDFLSSAEIAVRENLTWPQLAAELKSRAARTGILAYIQRFLRQHFKRTKIPKDPFATPGSGGLYRYGRPSTQSPQNIQYLMWVVAGNGPDGDADLDVTRFNPKADNIGRIPSRDLKVDLGLGCNPMDLIYDPTNGLTSNGDIFLISRPLLYNDELTSATRLLERVGAR